MESSRRERVTAEIRAELARRKLTQADLAEGSGIPLSTLKRRLGGERAFQYDELAAIASYFDMTLTDLIARTEAGAA